MRKLTLVVAAAALIFAACLDAQYKDKPPKQQPQPPMPPLITSKPVTATPQAQPTDGARRIPRPDAIKLVQQGKAIFIDVRARDQYDMEHIKGAISIPLDEITKRVSELPKNKLLITYCA